MSAIVIPAVKAYTPGLTMIYGALRHNYDPNEKTVESETCATIDCYYYYYDNDHAPPVNGYWTYTDANDVYSNLAYQASGDYCWWVNNFWVGDAFDAGAPPSPYGQYNFYGNGGYSNDTTPIQDNQVWKDATNNGRQSSIESVDFMWTCICGGLYWNSSYGTDYIPGILTGINATLYSKPTSPAVNTNVYYGYYNTAYETNIGMPFCWTGVGDLSTDGYDNSDQSGYCYIGFEGPSVQLQSQLDGWSQDASNFTINYYWAAINYGDDVRYCLDSAAYFMFGTNTFDQCPLYNGWWWTAGTDWWWFSTMRVLGDSYLSPAYYYC
jgi:hypothetical protein